MGWQRSMRPLHEEAASEGCEYSDTHPASCIKMSAMRKIILTGIVLSMVLSLGVAWAQKDKDNEPTSWLYFAVIKDDNGKPVRNAAVILHPVNEKGRQERGGIELKTSPEGKCDFDGVPYGPLR